MAMVLSRVIDPRDNLARATRDELWDFAKASGVTFEVGQAVATKPYMEAKLRALGVTNIEPAVRFQGRPTGENYGSKVLTGKPEEPAVKVTEVDAERDMLRQMKEQERQEDAERETAYLRSNPPLQLMSMNELRAECKRRGVKMDRRDNMNTLREKLSGQNAA